MTLKVSLLIGTLVVTLTACPWLPRPDPYITTRPEVSLVGSLNRVGDVVSVNASFDLRRARGFELDKITAPGNRFFAFIYGPKSREDSSGPYGSDPSLWPVPDVLEVIAPVTGPDRVPPPVEATLDRERGLLSASFTLRAARAGTAYLKVGFLRVPAGLEGFDITDRVSSTNYDALLTVSVGQ